MAAFLRAASVRKKTGLAKTQFYQRIADGTFPKAAARLGPRAPVWLESDIDDWIEAQVERARAEQRKVGVRRRQRPAAHTLMHNTGA